MYDTTRFSDMLDMMARSPSISDGFRAICSTSASEMRKLQEAYLALGGEIVWPSDEDDTPKLEAMLTELEKRPAVPLEVDEALMVREPTSFSTRELLRKDPNG